MPGLQEVVIRAMNLYSSMEGGRWANYSRSSKIAKLQNLLANHADDNDNDKSLAFDILALLNNDTELAAPSKIRTLFLELAKLAEVTLGTEKPSNYDNHLEEEFSNVRGYTEFCLAKEAYLTQFNQQLLLQQICSEQFEQEQAKRAVQQSLRCEQEKNFKLTEDLHLANQEITDLFIAIKAKQHALDEKLEEIFQLLNEIENMDCNLNHMQEHQLRMFAEMTSDINNLLFDRETLVDRIKQREKQLNNEVITREKLEAQIAALNENEKQFKLKLTQANLQITVLTNENKAIIREYDATLDEKLEEINQRDMKIAKINKTLAKTQETVTFFQEKLEESKIETSVTTARLHSALGTITSLKKENRECKQDVALERKEKDKALGILDQLRRKDGLPPFRSKASATSSSTTACAIPPKHNYNLRRP